MGKLSGVASAALLVAGSLGLSVDQRVTNDVNDHGFAHFLVTLRSQVAPSIYNAQRGNGSVTDSMAWNLYNALKEQKSSASHQSVLSTLHQCNATNVHSFTIFNGMRATGGQACIQALSQHNAVLAIENDRAFQAELATVTERGLASPQAVEWNVNWVKAPQVWNQGFRGRGTVHANADTGVEYAHPAISGQYRGNNGDSFDHNYNWADMSYLVYRKDQLGPFTPEKAKCDVNVTYPCDDNGHGTHTTGTTSGGFGANEIGVAPFSSWIACKNMFEGWGSPGSYIGCLEFLIAPTDIRGERPNPELRPHTVGNSYGCPPAEGCAPLAMEQALQAVRAAGVFMSVSAGNSGSACNTVNDPPALSPLVCSVGALAYQSNNIASYSSRGVVTVDGSNRRKPDIAAPGSSVRSAYPPNTYASLSGTSMASPAVAGVVLLLWEAFPPLARDVEKTEIGRAHV